MNTKICPTCKTPIPAHAPGGFCPACILRGADELPPLGRMAPSLAEVSAAFPQLEVLGLIGQGGMGFVYKVRQPSLDRTVALKILSPELGRDPAFAERFAREARVLGKLNHPNIVTVFESGVVAATPSSQTEQNAAPGIHYYYLIMEFVDGVNLRQAMRAGRFTPAQALAVVPGICDALGAAHAQGVWHRDIKPENILLDAQGGVKIVDFGIARIVGDPQRDFTLTMTGAALGSAAYMAPEQHESPHDVDHRADIYSLGVVIYEMLTGELPLGRFPAPSQRAAVSARIDEIVFQTLEKERSLRQQSADEVKTDVRRAAKNVDAIPDARAFQWTPRVVSKMAISAGLTLFVAAGAFTAGSTQGMLFTLASVPVVLGLLGLIFVERDDKQRQIELRYLKRFGYVAALFFVVSVGLFVVRGQRERVAAELARMAALQEMMKAQQDEIRTAESAKKKSAAILAEQAIRQSEAKATYGDATLGLPQTAEEVAARLEKASHEKFPELPAASPEAVATPAAATPVAANVQSAPAMSAEDVLRKLNALAKESNGDEFKKHLAVSTYGKEPSGNMADRMEPFLGKLSLVKTVAHEPGTKGLFSIRETTTVFGAFERADGKMSYREFRFTPESGEWRYQGSDYPKYRAVVRVEFRPESGNATAILRTHLNSKVVSKPVAGADGQFDIESQSSDAAWSANDANAIADRLKDSLKKVGLDTALKVIKKAEVPTKPIHAEEELESVTP